MQRVIRADDGLLDATPRWFRPVIPGQTPISISDLVELRAAVDMLRVAADLDPVAWEGKSADDPTFRAGETVVRARHFTQLREAIADLWRVAELGPLPEFTGGAIVPGSRAIRIGDPLDLRAWVERYEAAVPEKAARAVQLYDEYTAVYPDLILSPLPRQDAQHQQPRRRRLLTEEWDGAGFTRYGYDTVGRLSWRLRFVDDRAYAVRYAYGDDGSIQSVDYPAFDEPTATGPTATYHYSDRHELRGVETSLGLGYPFKLRQSGQTTSWVNDLLKLAEPKATQGQGVRVIRDLHGVPVKVVEGDTSRVWIDGAFPATGARPQTRVVARPIATVAWSTAAEPPVPLAYAIWSAFSQAGRLIGTFAPRSEDP
ncbi:MAG: hypothetical protein HY331_11685 [Chloroflexi bacterium]|nr:hypothetical protein [Chloroflexota bacterium]